MNTSTFPTLTVMWFDGLHPVAQPATVWFADRRLCVQAGDNTAPRDYAPAKLRWPEPLRRGASARFCCPTVACWPAPMPRPMTPGCARAGAATGLCRAGSRTRG